MTERDAFAAYVLDQLRNLDDVTCRRMFGGHGLYAGGTFFGILHESQLYLKTDDRTRGEYERRGCQPFRPTAKQTLKSYYEVPAEVIDDRQMLCAWAREAVSAGRGEGNRRNHTADEG